MRRLGYLMLGLAMATAVWSPPARAEVAVVVVDGRGWGHGVGMAQDGAYWMATSGRTMDEILNHFYPGTGRGSSTGTVRVVVQVADDGRAVLDFPDGGEVRSPRSGQQRAGFPVQVGPGGSVTISHGDGRYRVEPAGVRAASAGTAAQIDLPVGSTTTSSSTTSSSTTTTALLPGFGTTTTSTTAPGAPGAPGGPGATTTTSPPPPGADPAVTSPEPVWAGPVSGGATVAVRARGLRYRGELEVSAATGVLRVVNELDVEQYLWGLAEVPASFPLAAIQAQVVAARTYALRAMAANGEICDTQQCQVYRGASAEFARQIEAVNTTLGTTLTYRNRLASAVYSANAAGVSATPEEGFGTPNAAHPYLVAAPYETQSADPWTVEIALADLADRLGYPGTASAIRVARTGPSGRPLEVELDGDAGPQRYPALEADAAMGLRSTMWTVRLTSAAVAPDAPEPETLIQAPPDRIGPVIVTAGDDPETAAARRASTTTVLAASDEQAGPGGGPATAWLLVVPVAAAGAYGLRTLAAHRQATDHVPAGGDRRRRRDRPLRRGS